MHIIEGLANVGLPIAGAEQWPHGAVRWRKANDKLGYESVSHPYRRLFASERRHLPGQDVAFADV